MQQLHEKRCGNALHCQKELENGKRWTDQGHGVKEEKIQYMKHRMLRASQKDSGSNMFGHVHVC